jgi:hypothetical protein
VLERPDEVVQDEVQQYFFLQTMHSFVVKSFYLPLKTRKIPSNCTVTEQGSNRPQGRVSSSTVRFKHEGGGVKAFEAREAVRQGCH